MKHIGYINTEGGPLLLADASVSKYWNGIEGDGSDYKRACQLFDNDFGMEGGIIPIQNKNGILWEMKGGGTADVFTNDHLIVVRTWPSDQSDNTAPLLLAEMPCQQITEFGQLAIDTGIIVIAWAAESGKNMQLQSHPNKTQDSYLVLPMKNGVYRCIHDQVETRSGIARRCHLRLNPTRQP